MSHKIVTISLSEELLNKIEETRKDLPRSLVFKRLLESGLENKKEVIPQ